jgi:type I restriction enzyme, S subunit
MIINIIPFKDLLSKIIDNRGKTCPTSETGQPLIATNCVRNDSLYPQFEKIRYVDDETHKNWFRGHPTPGEMLFVTKGTPGRVCWVPGPVNFCIAQDMLSIRANEKIVYPKFLFALLRSAETQKMIENMHVGTLIPHFKKGDFNQLFLSIPSDRKVQERIGDTYFNFSEKIELNRQTNTTLESIAQKIFKEWFVDFRFPGATGEMQDSELGPIPKGWRVGKVGEICEVNMNTISKRDIFDHIEYIEISEVNRGVIGKTSIYTYGAEPSRAKRKLKHGDTVLSTVRPHRGAYFLALNPSSNLIASTGFAVFAPTAVPPSFLYLLLTASEKLEYYGHVADGGAYPAINPNLIMDIDIVVPREDVLNDFQSVAESLFEEIDNNNHQSTILTQLRDALLPKLMSGEIEV